MSTINIAINGKFFGSIGTGVQRVAEELIIALDQLLTEDAALKQKFNIEIFSPTNSFIHLSTTRIIKENGGFLSGLFKNIPWEHINLPMLARGKTILSLCNIGPIFSKNAIVMIHDAQFYIAPDSYSLWFKLWYKFTTHMTGLMSAKILTVSEYSKEQLVKYNIAKAEKITVIHNGCDHILRTEADDHIFEKLKLAKTTKYCVAQSNTKNYKNIGVLFKAFASDELKDVTLVLYGSAGKQAFESMGHHVPSNVVFTGRISDAELKALIQQAQATLTPSLTEGFGLQPLEGMILGCPAIVAPCGALPEMCGDVGLYANPNQPEAWIKAIRYVIDNQAFTENLKEKIKVHAKQFTWEQAAKKLLTVLD